MESPESFVLRLARWCAFGSAASVLISGTAVPDILLALSLAALLMSGARLRLPRIWLPIAVFMALTLLSMAFSGKPSAGIPQVRKFYVYLELLVIFSTFNLAWVRRLFWAWCVLAAASGAWACVQFARRIGQARALGRPFYDYYLADNRVTGFMSHWNHFSAQMMFMIFFVVAFVLFAERVRGWMIALAAACAAIAAVGMVLGFTRTIIFMACPAGILYLVWWWKKWLVVALPLAALLIVMVSPAPIKERFESIFHPKQNVDSNDFRRVTRRVGWEMIKAHPLLGLGPERPKELFAEYVPKDIGKLPEGWYGHLHSIYIHYAAERGIPAMLALVWLLGQITYDFWRGAMRLGTKRSDARFVLHAGTAVMIGVILEGFFELNLGVSPVLTMFLAAVGCGYTALEAGVG